MPAGKEGAKVSSARAVSAVYLALWEPTSAPRLLSDVCSLMGLGKKTKLEFRSSFPYSSKPSLILAAGPVFP